MQDTHISIIKIGGSVLTDKRLDSPVMRKIQATGIARELVAYQSASSQDRLVLIHGVGSFGHPLAAKYRIQNENPAVKPVRGVAHTHLSVRELNLSFAKVLLEAGCPVIPLSPLHLVGQSKGRIASFNTKIITDLLWAGFTPLLHGDVVQDTAWGFSVCSGDQITTYLARTLKAKRMLFVSDVNGVAEADPDINPKAHFFKTLSGSSISRLSKNNIQNTALDVTGAMTGKLREILHSKIPATIFSGLERGNLLAVLNGEQRGTLILTNGRIKR